MKESSEKLKTRGQVEKMERLEAKLQAVGTVPGMKITRWLPKRVKLLRKMSENVAKMMLAFQLLVALSSAAQMHNSSHSGLSRRASKYM